MITQINVQSVKTRHGQAGHYVVLFANAKVYMYGTLDKLTLTLRLRFHHQSNSQFMSVNVRYHSTFKKLLFTNHTVTTQHTSLLVLLNSLNVQSLKCPLRNAERACGMKCTESMNGLNLCSHTVIVQRIQRLKSTRCRMCHAVQFVENKCALTTLSLSVFF